MGTEVSQIACGKKHTLALVPSRGRLYSFGLGGCGQLGNNSFTRLVNICLQIKEFYVKTKMIFPFQVQPIHKLFMVPGLAKVKIPLRKLSLFIVLVCFFRQNSITKIPSHFMIFYRCWR